MNKSKIAKILQYGDTYPDVFVFPSANESEDWGDEMRSSVSQFPQRNGGYDFNDGISLKATKVLTKRFDLVSDCLQKMWLASSKIQGNDLTCKTSNGYLRYMKDHLYRILRGDIYSGGYKKLYVVMEDGSVRWTWAKPISIPYIQDSNVGNKDALPMSIDFECPEPYFYEVIDPNYQYFTGFNFFDLIFEYCSIDSYFVSKEADTILTRGQQICRTSNCDENGVILYNPPQVCDVQPCDDHPCFMGDKFITNGDTSIPICINGSAGARRPSIAFINAFNNPTLLNQTTGSQVSYNGVINDFEYLIIDLSSNFNGEIVDLDVSTNIAGFDINDIIINNDGFWDFTIGNNDLLVQGGLNANSIFMLKYENKYHN